jgi:hypothetical protein
MCGNFFHHFIEFCFGTFHFVCFIPKSSFLVLQSTGRLLICPANMIPWWQNVTVTNTMAYYITVWINPKQFYTVRPYVVNFFITSLNSVLELFICAFHTQKLFLVLHSTGRLLSCPHNMRPWLQHVTVTNTLAYYTTLWINLKKFYTVGQCVVTFFVTSLNSVLELFILCVSYTRGTFWYSNLLVGS